MNRLSPTIAAPTRRALLATSAFAAAALVGCTQAQVQSTLATLAAGWAALPGLLSGANVPLSASVSAQVSAALAELETNANAIGTAVGAPPTTVNTIVTDITLVGNLLSPFFPGTTAIGALVGAGVSLIGTLLTEAGLTAATQVTALNAKTQTLAAMTPTPSAALAVLRSYAK